MHIAAYQMGEFKILESDTGELGWETHCGIGETKEGRCFRKGAILFIGPAETRRAGFLKLEFLSHLKECPAWSKTTYYCNGLDVYHCRSGEKVTRDEMRLWMLEGPNAKRGSRYSAKSGGPAKNISNRAAVEGVSYRLRRYEIIMASDNHIIWKTHSGQNTVNSGRCAILEDILFISGPQGAPTSMSKRQFIGNMEMLPEWNGTTYYSANLSLHECVAAKGIENRKWSWSNKWKNENKYLKNINKPAVNYKTIGSDELLTNANIFFKRTGKWLVCFVDGLILITSDVLSYLIRFWKQRK